MMGVGEKGGGGGMLFVDDARHCCANRMLSSTAWMQFFERCNVFEQLLFTFSFNHHPSYHEHEPVAVVAVLTKPKAATKGCPQGIFTRSGHPGR